MAVHLNFEGGAIFNREHYPSDIMDQAMPVMKQMGKNLETTYARVDGEGAKRDLSSIGYAVKETTHTESMTSVNSSTVDDRIADMLRDLFQEDIHIEEGRDRILVLMTYAMDGSVAQTDNNFFASSTQSEGKYFSYQMAFYSQRRASFCFLVLTLVAFKDEGYVFGIPTGIKTGISYSVQVFECRKIHNNVLYNFSRLESGESMGSPDGKHLATLGDDGDFVVDGRWKTDTAGKGAGPWYLTLQEDANLVIYDSSGDATWASGSHPGRFSESPWHLSMQDDGNLVIYDSKDEVLWAIGI